MAVGTGCSSADRLAAGTGCSFADRSAADTGCSSAGRLAADTGCSDALCRTDSHAGHCGNPVHGRLQYE